MRIIIRFMCFATMLLSLGLFVVSLISCGPVYKAVGLQPLQVEQQIAKDANSVVQFVEQTRDTFWPIANAAIAGVATIISGYLGVALKKEKAITRTIITGVELANNEETKDAIFLASTVANNAKTVNARVQTFTGGVDLPKITPKKQAE